jgi:DNA-binding NarL/FixJ family response regulator
MDPPSSNGPDGRMVPALIVEDDAATQARLHRLLGDVVGSTEHIDVAGSAEAARDRLAAGAHRLALVDITLPGENGLALIEWLRRAQPAVQAVVVSAWADEITIVRAIQAGAVGYLLKNADDLELTVSLRSLQRGGAPIDPGIARCILELLPARQPDADAAASAGALRGAPADAHVLTPRETGILQLVARGFSNREIAERIALSRLTIETHTRNIYRKLEVRSRTAAVFQAQSLGLLD